MRFRTKIVMKDGRVVFGADKRVQFTYPLERCVSEHCTRLVVSGVLNAMDHVELFYRYDEVDPDTYWPVAVVRHNGYRLNRKMILAMSEEIV